MAFYRRRLPHLHECGQPIFLTWRLHDSLPLHRSFPVAALNSGQAFAAMDRLLDEARVGSFYLRQPLIAIWSWKPSGYNAGSLKHYLLHAFVVMPNHVHLLATPFFDLRRITKFFEGHHGQNGPTPY